jgi:predicted dehydrogenase
MLSYYLSKEKIVEKIENPAFAIVGMGGFARTHIRYMGEVVALGIGRQVAQVAIKADQQQFATEITALRQQGVEVFSSLRELLAQSRQQIDVVTVPTGIPLHRPMCQAALEAGCHVVLEKPVAGSVQDVDALLAAATRAGKRVAVGFQGIYSHEVANAQGVDLRGALWSGAQRAGLGVLATAA